MEAIISFKITINKTKPGHLAHGIGTSFSEVLLSASHHPDQHRLESSHLFEFEVVIIKLATLMMTAKHTKMLPMLTKVMLDLLLMKEGLAFTYLYDFGDYWQHTVEVKKILDKEEGKGYPICIDGQLACPPEDSGGIHGFYKNLEILKTKDIQSMLRLRNGLVEVMIRRNSISTRPTRITEV